MDVTCAVLQALEAGSSAALPEGVKGELERLEENGGVKHLSELAEQIKVSFFPSFLA